MCGCRLKFLLTSTLLLSTLTTACTQDSQFAFDLSGNLDSRYPATTALPQILAQPQQQVVRPGELASFFIVARDTRSLTYQWRFNQTNVLGGATGDALLLTNVSALNEGLYSVVLSNSSGSVTSSPAALLIDADGDELPDSWELTYIGSLTNNPTADFDGDGSSNLDEFHADTNPTNSASARFQLTLISDGGGFVEASPTRLSYTNGETVTLTATPFAPHTFHAWTGAMVTRSNPLTFTVTSNTTLRAWFNPLDLVWTNVASGDWNTPSNWSPNLLPSALDNVVITRPVTVTINSAAACRDFIMGTSINFVTLTGTGTLTINGVATWLRGRMSGSGSTVVAPGATLTLAAPDAHYLDVRTLENAGTVLWTAGALSLSTAVITNRAGALFDVRNDSIIDYVGGLPPRFDNVGTFRKSASIGTTTIDINLAFNNSGAVEIQSGTLVLNGGTHSGSFEVQAGKTLRLAGNHSATGSSSITGAGNLLLGSGGGTVTLAGLVNVTGTNTFSGPTVTLSGNYICTNTTLVVSGGTVNFNGTGAVMPATLNLIGGFLSGSSNVTVLGSMTWSGGVMSGSGRSIIPSGATLTIPNTTGISLNGRTLDNTGTILWPSSALADFNLTSGAVITNRPGALFHVQNARTFTTGAGSRIDNAGTFRKSGNTGTSTINSGLTLNNYGTAEILNGTLELAGGGLNNGAIAVSAGSTLQFSGGTFSANSSSSITGGGNLTVLNATVTLAGLVNLTGTHNFFSGTANLTGNYICTNNTLAISGATVNFNGTGPVTPQVLNLGLGFLSGSLNVTVVGSMTWSGGGMSGSGRTFIPSGVTLTMPNTTGLVLNRTLDNAGTILWPPSAQADLALSPGVITNRPGALFHVQNARTFLTGGGSRIDNAGTFRKSGTTGTSTINSGLTLNNYGTVEIRSGILQANGGYSSASNALLNCALGGTTAGTGYGQLRQSGTITLGGALSVELLPGFTPATNDTFTVVTAGSRSGVFTSFSYPSNRIAMSLSNSPTSVILTVTNVFPIPEPVLLTPQIAGSNALLTWTAASNITYRLERKSDAGATNWTEISGDVTTTSNTASKLDPITSSNRFYRVRALP